MSRSHAPRSPFVPRSLLLLSFPLLAGIGRAQITPIVLEGQSVPGVGNVTLIDNLAVNSQGVWLVEADTDQANTDTDQVLLKSGALFLREGQVLAAPAGASIDSFDTIDLNATGQSGWNFFLGNTGGTGNDSGIFLGDQLTLQEGTLSSAAGFSPGTPYVGFFECKIDSASRILIVASVDDPAIASTVDRALVVFDVDSASGALLGETVIFKEGDALPGQTALVTDFGTGPHNFDFNDAGDVLFVADLDSPTADGVVYRNGTLLAQEGSPSPVAGRNWLTLSTSMRMALNAGGSHVHTGTLDGDTASDSVIVRDGALYRQEGDSPPPIAPFALTSFGTSAPVDLDDQGRVLWFGDWNDPDTTRDTGLFLDDLLLVQEGVTEINGQTLSGLSGVQDAFAISPDGRWVIFEGTLSGSLAGAFLIDLDGCLPSAAYCTASTTSLPGCQALLASSGAPSLANPGGFAIAAGAVPGEVLGICFFGENGAAAVPFGSSGGFVCVQGPVFRAAPKSSGGVSGSCSGVLAFTLADLIAASTIVEDGNTIHAELWFRDPPNLPDGFGLSNAIRFTVCR